MSNTWFPIGEDRSAATRIPGETAGDLEAKLKHSVERLTLALRSAGAGWWEWDPSSGLETWSDEMCDLYGLPHGSSPAPGEAMAMLHPEDLGRVMRRVQELMAVRSERWHDQFRVQHPIRGIVWIDAYGSISYDCQGRPQRMVGVNFDITAQKESEKALHELRSALERQVTEGTAQLRALNAQLSRAELRESRRIAQLLHDDLQQVLITQRLTLDGLKQRVPSKFRPDFDMAYRAANEALRLCRSLSADLAVPALNEPGLRPLLEWLSGRVREQHSLEVRLDASGEDLEPPFSAKVEVYRVVRELLLNVAKHAGVNRATLTLDTSTPNECALTVADRGRGFDPRQPSLLHDDASGLGLAAVRGRIARLGGSVAIDSRPGAGTRVRVRFPVPGASRLLDAEPMRAEAAREPQQVPPLAANVGFARVLLVDDHRLVRTILRTLLEEAGEFEVVGEAGDGTEGVELALQLQPDVVLMDVNMPRLNGIEATRRLTEAAPHITVVGLSMLDSKEIVDAMHAAGARGYVTKDTDLPGLCNGIRAALASRPRNNDARLAAGN